MKDDQQLEDEIVMVPVPRRHLQAVYEALANAMAQGAGAPEREVDSVVSVNVPGQGDWTAEQVQKLAVELEPYPALQHLMTMLAERAPGSIWFAEAAEATGMSEKKFRGAMSSLSKTTKRSFGEITWPFQVRFAADGTASYSMDPQVAEWWTWTTQK